MANPAVKQEFPQERGNQVEIHFDGERVPLDWLPKDVRGRVHLVRALYNLSMPRLATIVRFPEPDLTIPFELVRAAARLEFRGLDRRILLQAFVRAVSLDPREALCAPEDRPRRLDRCVILELLPKPAPGQAPIDFGRHTPGEL